MKAENIAGLFRRQSEEKERKISEEFEMCVKQYMPNLANVTEEEINKCLQVINTYEITWQNYNSLIAEMSLFLKKNRAHISKQYSNKRAPEYLRASHDIDKLEFLIKKYTIKRDKAKEMARALVEGARLNDIEISYIGKSDAPEPILRTEQDDKSAINPAESETLNVSPETTSDNKPPNNKTSDDKTIDDFVKDDEICEKQSLDKNHGSIRDKPNMSQSKSPKKADALYGKKNSLPNHSAAKTKHSLFSDVLKDTTGIDYYVSSALSDRADSMGKAEIFADYLRELSGFVWHRNNNIKLGYRRLVETYDSEKIKTEQDAKTLLKAAINHGFYINRYDNQLADESMRAEMAREYCLNTDQSLKTIAAKISKKYSMNVSEYTIRKYARKALDSNSAKRSDGSAKRLYLNKNQKACA